LNRKPTDFVAEVNAHPLKADLFMELAVIANDAMAGRRRFLPPDAERCFEDAPPNALFLTDMPENQMGMTIVDECQRRFPDGETGRETSQSFVFRWFAIQDAFHAGKLADFVKINGKKLTIHSAVFEAAADCPLESDGEFGSSYLDRVKVIYQRDKGE
jgi:hypothetical protein